MPYSDERITKPPYGQGWRGLASILLFVSVLAFLSFLTGRSYEKGNISDDVREAKVLYSEALKENKKLKNSMKLANDNLEFLRTEKETKLGQVDSLNRQLADEQLKSKDPEVIIIRESKFYGKDFADKFKAEARERRKLDLSLRP